MKFFSRVVIIAAILAIVFGAILVWQSIELEDNRERYGCAGFEDCRAE